MQPKIDLGQNLALKRVGVHANFVRLAWISMRVTMETSTRNSLLYTPALYHLSSLLNFQVLNTSLLRFEEIRISRDDLLQIKT